MTPPTSEHAAIKQACLAKLGHQPHAVLQHETVGLHAGYVLVEAQVRVEPGPANSGGTAKLNTTMSENSVH